jgi:1-acyl-sn-glycerol-3-phosphate acyltransferase
MKNKLFSLHLFASKNKLLFFVILLLLIVSFGFFASKITFQENITQLIPSNDQSKLTSKVLEQVNFSDKTTILIRRKSHGCVDDLSSSASELLDSINLNCNSYIRKIQGKVDEENIQESFNFIYNNLPIFLDENDYKFIENKIQKDSINSILESDYKSLMSPSGIVSRDFILKDPLGISFIALKKLQQLNIGDNYSLHNGYVVTKDNNNLLLFITTKLPANETDKNTLFIEKLNKITQNINSKYSGKCEISYFGSTPVAVANATQIKADVRNTSIFATVCLILILALFYRNIATPIMIFIPSIFGALFALAILYFFKGTISAISLGISSILLGETTDYSIYVLTHLRNKKDVKLLYTDISKPLILCGITTSITFLCLFFIKSDALNDLGIFASISVLSTTFFSLTIIPFLYKNNSQTNENKLNLIDKLGAYSFEKNKNLVIASLMMLIVCLFTYSKVSFNNNLSEINFMTPELKATEKSLINIDGTSTKSLYLVTYSSSQNSVLNQNNQLFETLNKLKKDKKIINFSSIGGFIYSNEIQVKRIAKWNSFWADKKELLKSNLISNGKKIGFKEDTFKDFYKVLNIKYIPISLDNFNKIKTFYLEEFLSNKNGFRTISTLVKVSNEQRDHFVNSIKRNDNIVIIDRQETNESFLGALKKNFVNLVDYSFIVIFIVLLIAFRRMELVLITLVPVVISWIFTTGIMGIFDIQFNVINIIVCTLIFGIGVDYSIFMTIALQKEQTYGKIEVPTYRTSILLSVATTILGIGVLILAKHPALKSIALIAIIGIFSALLMTFIIQPLVFNFFITKRVKKGLAPIEIKRLIHSILSFIYYGLGGFLISIISLIFIKTLPISKKIKLRVFHSIMSKFMESVFWTYPSNLRTIKNVNNEKFDKPAILIANHTSFLDILAVGMLSPKVIFLVSDWVYNSPVFGIGVRLAGFYPVSNGIDNGIDHLKQKVEEGYLLILFPEGSRSDDNTIQRFKKGAFYLSEQLQVDIIPIFIHGYSEILPKGEYVIVGGSTTVEIGERISPSDNRFGIDFADRTKKISDYYKNHFREMRAELEHKNYFKKMILNSFAYKEMEVISELKYNLDINLKKYHLLNKFIPDNSNVFHIANDFGELDVLLTLQEPKRKITTFIIDKVKREVAKTNYLIKKRKISYLNHFEEFESKIKDVVLISNNNFSFELFTINKFNKIILINSKIDNLQLLFNDYSIEFEDINTVVLNKKSI